MNPELENKEEDDFDSGSMLGVEMGSQAMEHLGVDSDALLKPFNSDLLEEQSGAQAQTGSSEEAHVHATEPRPKNDISENSGYDAQSQTFIEIATYAGVDVYECYTKEKPPCLVMRRCNDDWLNITQVFKAGSFTKAQRTKILEKEANEIKHEKIQGGYGRFQGTWIPWESTKYLVEKYNIENDVVKRIVEFIPDPNNLPSRRSKVSQIKKLDPNARITSPSAYKKTPKKNTKTPMKKKSSVRRSTKKEKIIQPSPLQNIMFQTPQHQNQLQSSNQSTEKLSTLQSEHDTPMVPVSKVNSTVLSQGAHPIKYQTTQKPLQFFPYPQTHQFQPQVINSTSNDVQLRSGSNGKHLQIKTQKNFKAMTQMIHNATMSNSDTIHNNIANNSIQSAGSLVSNSTSTGSSIEVFSSTEKPSSSSSESPTPSSAVEKISAPPNYYKELILQVLSSEYESAEPDLPEALYRPPANLDINFLIDDQGHTPLHWAVAMSNIPLIRVLLVQDANILACNDKGFNCLTKSVFYNNCYKAGSFQQIISMLKPCLITPDANGRLPLHYIVELTVNKSKEPHVIAYYMDTIIDMLGKEDSNLLRMTLNYQDSMGNTPLHLAALNKNVNLCQKLVYFGASPDILNGEHQTVSMILSRFTAPNMFQPTLPAQILQSPSKTTFLSNTPRNSQDEHLEDKSKYSFNDTMDSSILSSSKKFHASERNDSLSLDKMKGSLTPAIKLNPPSPPTLIKLHNKVTEEGTKKVRLNGCKDSATLKATSQLSSLTNSLTSLLDDSLAKLQYDIQVKNDQIAEIDNQLNNINSREKRISDANKDKKVTSLQKGLSLKNIQLDNYMERSQALSLATLVQDEENNFSKDLSHLAKKSEEKEAIQLMVELCLKQYKRRHLIKQIKDARDQLVANGKISKFRRLIGMSIDNIDTKLDDIEKDLRSMETVQTNN